VKRVAIVALILLAVLVVAILSFRPVPIRFEGKTSEEWSEALGSRIPETHRPAIERLRRGGAEAVPVLLEILDGEVDLARVNAVRALALIGPEARDAVPALLAALTEGDTRLRRTAIDALGEIRPEDAEAVATIRALIDHADEPTRRSAMVTLGRIGAPAAATSVDLAKIAADPREKETTRSTALLALCALGSEAAAGREPLEKILLDESAHLRALAAAALGRIDPDHEPALEVLLQILAGPRSEAGVAPAAVAEFGARARPAVPLLEKYFEEAPLRRRAPLAFALARIDEDPEPHVRALIEIVGIVTDDGPGPAIVMLGCLGPIAAEAIPALEPFVEHPRLGSHAKAAIRRIRGEEPVPTDLWTFSR